MRILAIVTIAFFGFSNSIFAQDPHFTQHFSTGIYNNPAFTGSAGKARLNAAYRNQWPNLTVGGKGAGFQTYFLSFDISKKKMPLDIGVFSLHDRAGSASFLTTQSGISLGRSFKLYKNLSLRIGFSGAISKKTIDLQNLFALNPNDPVLMQKKSINYASINFGLVLHSNRFLIGISANNMNRPDQNLYGGTSRLAVRYCSQGAFRINFKDAENLNGFYISGNYLKQSYSNFLLPGIIYRYKSLRAGLAYRSNEAYIFNAAFTSKNLSIAYSYDYTVSKLTNQTGGSHEITINWTFGKLNEKRPGIGFISSLF